jgi:hypothetical protein
MRHMPPLWIGASVSEGFDEIEVEVEDVEVDFDGLIGMLGMSKVAVELTRSGTSGGTPSLPPSSSSRLSGARVHAAPLVVVVVLPVVVVPTMPQAVSVALYNSVHVDEVGEAVDVVPLTMYVQVLKTSVTVVF